MAFASDRPATQPSCPGCGKQFENPKILPCLHTFCRRCLMDAVDRDPTGSLSCPSCFRHVPLNENGVDGLRANMFIENILGIISHNTNKKRGREVRVRQLVRISSVEFVVIAKKVYGLPRIARIVMNHCVPIAQELTNVYG